MTKYDLSGRVAIVSGGGRGMGASHVNALVEAGARVVCGDVLVEEGRALVENIASDRVAFQPLDVRQSTDWAAAVALAEERYGPVSILVNNAGILVAGPVETLAEEDFRRVLDINTVGTFLGMQAIIPSMRRAGGGSIINISSTAGFAGMPSLGAYAASKFAVRGMTKVAALELGRDNIRVNSIHPGGVATPMTAGMATPAIPLPRFAAPEEVSRMVLYLASDDTAYCTGSEFTIDGGLLCMVGGSDLPS